MTNDEWYERERAAFIAWWESEGQAKFGATPTLAAGAGWLAKAEAVRPEARPTKPFDEAARKIIVKYAHGNMSDEWLYNELVAWANNEEGDETRKPD
jgi:hypothetical protein